MVVISSLDKNDWSAILCLGFKVCLHDFLPQILYGLQTALLAPNQIGECVISREQKGNG